MDFLERTGPSPIKGSVPLVADVLGISEPSVYRYIDQAKSNREADGERPTPAPADRVNSGVRPSPPARTRNDGRMDGQGYTTDADYLVRTGAELRGKAAHALLTANFFQWGSMTPRERYGSPLVADVVDGHYQNARTSMLAVLWRMQALLDAHGEAVAEAGRVYKLQEELSEQRFTDRDR